MQQSLAAGSPSGGRVRRCRAQVPVVANLGHVGVVVWFHARGDALLDGEGLGCGLRFDAIEGWSFEVTEQRFEKSMYPEAWLVKSWPAVPIGSGDESDELRSSESIAHPLQAEIEFVGSEWQSESLNGEQVLRAPARE